MSEPVPQQVIIASSQRFVSSPSCRTGLSRAGLSTLEGSTLICTRCGAELVLRIGNAPHGT